MVCERIGLDGIIFVSSHYFMAALGRRHLSVLEEDVTLSFLRRSPGLSPASLWQMQLMPSRREERSTPPAAPT